MFPRGLYKSIASGFPWLFSQVHSFSLQLFPLKWYPALHSMQMFSPWFVQSAPVAFSPFGMYTPLNAAISLLWHPALHSMQMFSPWFVQSAPVAFSPFSQVHSFWLQLFPLKDILPVHFMQMFSPWFVQALPVALSPFSDKCSFWMQLVPLCDIQNCTWCKCFLRGLLNQRQWLSRRSRKCTRFECS